MSIDSIGSTNIVIHSVLPMERDNLYSNMSRVLYLLCLG